MQFEGPVQPEWHQALEATGVQVIAYIPEDGYLVYGDHAGLSAIRALRDSCAFLMWDGDYLQAYKLAATPVEAGDAAPQLPSPTPYAVQLVKDPMANPTTLSMIEQNRTGPVLSRFNVLNYVDIVVSLPPAWTPALAARSDVVAVQPYSDPVLHDERQDQILAGNLTGGSPSGPGYLSWFLGKGFTQAQFTASGLIVDVTDSGIDGGTTAPTHFGLYEGGILPGASRVAYSRLVGTPNLRSTTQGCDGHGTLNAHVVAGYDDSAGFPFADASGFHYGLGVCPFVKVGSSVVFDPAWTHPSYPDIQSMAYQDGARISSNSWGFSAAGSYDMHAQAYDALVRDAQPAGSTFPVDGNQEMVIVFSAGNDGPGSSSIGSPGTAKNVITVGAEENVHPFGGPDGCAITDSQADSADDVAGFSSRGPCADGRKKPDLVAPGTHVSGGVFQVASPPSAGQADPCFTGTGVCGGSGFSLYWPAGQQWYTASSGTSHACPAVSGAAALLRQYFLSSRNGPPSPAMTKACLVSSTRYLSGAGAGDALWSNSQGMGGVNLGEAFDGAPRILRDQAPGDTFSATGQSRTFTGTGADPSKPLRVTLAWTDAPGSIVSAVALVNDLDLTVTAEGITYKGNLFSGQYSRQDGTSDDRNNVESVFLPAGIAGPFAITVMASNIAGVGVPNPANTPIQDFALVAYNTLESPSPVLAKNAATLTAESCTPANGAVDPGETVTVNLSLKNVGVADTAGLVATLQHSGGVVPITATQSYGVLTAGGAASSRPFTFLANGTCGGTVTATLDLKDGDTGLGTVSFTFPLGTTAGCCAGTGPKPVPDGFWIPGTPVMVPKVAPDGSSAFVTWDATTCPASAYNVYSGPLASVSTYAYDGWACGVTPEGAADVPLNPGNVFFVVVAVENGVEGSHGRDGAGVERPGAGVGQCAVTVKDSSGVCP